MADEEAIEAMEAGGTGALVLVVVALAAMMAGCLWAILRHRR